MIVGDIHWALKYATSGAPTTEPISTAEAKAHLRVTVSDDDTLIDSLVEAARLRFESDTHRAMITQNWELTLDSFPNSSDVAILLPRPPLQSVTSIKYDDTDGNEQTWSSGSYRVDTDSEPARVTPEYSEVYPTTRSVTGAVRIVYKTGYGDAASAVPQSFIQAMLMLVGHWYENREAVVVGVTTMDVPMTYQFMVAPWVVWT